MNNLPRWLKILTIAGLTAVLGGGIAFYCITRQPDSFVTQKIIRPVVSFMSGFKQFEDVAESKPAFSMTSKELHSAFEKDEANAGKMYNGKVIEVSGTISSIAAPTETNIVILLSIEDNPVSNVSCQMDAAFNDRLQKYAAGSQVAIKGICNGAKKDDLLGSLDVLLNRCVIVN